MSNLSFSNFKGIPFGQMTLEQFVVSNTGKEIVRLLKKVSDDPLKLIVPFLVAYQVADLRRQFEDKHPDLLEASGLRESVIDLCNQHVISELESILHVIGEESLEWLAKILSPEEKINKLKKGKS